MVAQKCVDLINCLSACYKDSAREVDHFCKKTGQIDA
jgi:hypothetical protein